MCDKNFYFFGVVIPLNIAFAYRNLKPVVNGHHVSFVSFPLDLYRTPDSLQQDTEANYGTKWIQPALRKILACEYVVKALAMSIISMDVLHLCGLTDFHVSVHGRAQDPRCQRTGRVSGMLFGAEI